MSDTLSCGCPTSGPPCEHASIKGKKRGGAGKLKAERDEAVRLLRELFVIAGDFEAIPPDAAPDYYPFGQSTTASQCRELSAVLAVVRAFLAKQ
jgi:hypothetical protein